MFSKQERLTTKDYRVALFLVTGELSYIKEKILSYPLDRRQG